MQASPGQDCLRHGHLFSLSLNPMLLSTLPNYQALHSLSWSAFPEFNCNGSFWVLKKTASNPSFAMKGEGSSSSDKEQWVAVDGNIFPRPVTVDFIITELVDLGTQPSPRPAFQVAQILAGGDMIWSSHGGNLELGQSRDNLAILCSFFSSACRSIALDFLDS